MTEDRAPLSDAPYTTSSFTPRPDQPIIVGAAPPADAPSIRMVTGAVDCPHCGREATAVMAVEDPGAPTDDDWKCVDAMTRMSRVPMNAGNRAALSRVLSAAKEAERLAQRVRDLEYDRTVVQGWRNADAEREDTLRARVEALEKALEEIGRLSHATHGYATALIAIDQLVGAALAHERSEK